MTSRPAAFRRSKSRDKLQPQPTQGAEQSGNLIENRLPFLHWNSHCDRTCLPLITIQQGHLTCTFCGVEYLSLRVSVKERGASKVPTWLKQAGALGASEVLASSNDTASFVIHRSSGRSVHSHRMSGCIISRELRRAFLDSQSHWALLKFVNKRYRRLDTG